MARSIYRSRICVGFGATLILACLLASWLPQVSAIGREKTPTGSDVSKGPILLKQGEAIPTYQHIAEDQSNSVMEGVRLLGEWMMGVGLFSAEKPFIAAQLDPSELMDTLDEGLLLPSENKRSLQDTDEAVALALQQTSAEINKNLCSGRGVFLNKTGLVDKCHGYSCYISSMVCDGIPFSGDSLHDYIGPMDHCKVRSISCPSKFEPETTFPSLCPIQQFLCPNNRTVLPSDIGGQAMSDCAVQVYCMDQNQTTHTFYGYDAYDYECTESQLVCNGQVIANPQGYRGSNDTCSIRKGPCKTVGAAGNCTTDITETCATDPSDDLCDSFVDHRLPAASCPSSGPRPYASIETISCLDGTHNYNTWNGSIATCTSIMSVKQNGVVVNLPYIPLLNSYCVLTELDCGGVRTPWNYTARIPQGCGVARIVCGLQPLPGITPTCSTHDFGCATPSTVCLYNANTEACSLRCQQPGMKEQCDCPVDWTGSRCDLPRSMKCDLNITSASIVRGGRTSSEPYSWTQDCYKDLPKRHLGDPVCHELHKNDELTLNAKVHCNFTDGPLDVLLQNSVSDFKYILYAQDFRLSNVTWSPRWNLSMKVLNWNSFTDWAGSTTLTLTPQQMAGNSTVTFKVKPSALDSKYATGGRIRAEWQFTGLATSPFLIPNVVLLGSTLDIMDWTSNYPSGSGFISTRVITFAVLGVIIAFILALYAYRWWRKRKDEAQSRQDY